MTDKTALPYPALAPTAALHLQLAPDRLQLSWLCAGPTPAPYTAPLGWRTVAQLCDPRGPTAAGVEHAIAVVEDAVMPASRWLAQAPGAMAPPWSLQSGSPWIAAMADAAGVPPGTPVRTLSRQAVENLFQHGVQQLHRGVVAAPEGASPADWAAALIMVREALHHWDVAWLQWMEARGGD